LKLLMVVEPLELDSITIVLIAADRRLKKDHLSCFGSPDVRARKTWYNAPTRSATNPKDRRVGRYHHQRGFTVLPAGKRIHFR
jgi:hypothetical protein